MKITLHRYSKNVAIALTILSVIASLVLGYFWKKEHDRHECVLNLRDIYFAIYGGAGLENIGPGQPIPGGVRKLFERMTGNALPVCPSGGTYSFANETTYTMGKVNDINDNVRCSHAVDLGHVWSN
jgi:hypothetical protein